MGCSASSYGPPGADQLPRGIMSVCTESADAGRDKESPKIEAGDGEGHC